MLGNLVIKAEFSSILGISIDKKFIKIYSKQEDKLNELECILGN